MVQRIKFNLGVLLSAALLLGVVGCTEQPDVHVNNNYITNNSENIRSDISDTVISDMSSGLDTENDLSSKSMANDTTSTDLNLIVGINYTVIKTTNYLAIRSAPAYDGNNEIAKMKNGDELTVKSQSVYGEKGEYCYITALTGAAKGQSGYVNKNYITPSSSITTASQFSSTNTESKLEEKETEKGEASSAVQPDIVSTASREQADDGSIIDVSELFESIPSDFYFSSGVGNWYTHIIISNDGSFIGSYADYDLGVTGPGYPKGSAFICDFTGKFTNVTKIDDYTYSMYVVSLEQEGTKGDEYIEDETKYTIASPYGFDNAEEFMLYLPGKPISELSEDFLSWVRVGYNEEIVLPDGVYGLYNVNGMQGFRGDK